MFTQFVKPLLGLDDLFAGLGMHLDLLGFGGDVAAKADQLAPHRKVIDHLGIVAGGIGRNGGTGQTHQIGRTAQFLEPRVVVEKGFHGHGRSKGVLLDAGCGTFKDALMDRIKEMLGFYKGRDAIIDLVIGQDGAQKLLFSLDVMRKGVGFRSGGRKHLPQSCQFIHGLSLVRRPADPT